MAGTLEKLRRDQAARLEAHRAAYVGYVIRLADWEDVDADEVRETLEALGLTVARLDADVADRQERVRLAVEANEGPDLRRRLDEANVAVGDAQRRNDETIRRLQEEFEPLVAARDALANRAASAEVARLALQKKFLADVLVGKSAADAARGEAVPFGAERDRSRSAADRSAAFRQEVASRRRA